MTQTLSVDLKEKNRELIAKKITEIKHFKREFYLHNCGELQHFMSHSEVPGKNCDANPALLVVSSSTTMTVATLNAKTIGSEQSLLTINMDHAQL